MKISSVDLRVVSLPLVEPFETSLGREDKHTAIIVTLRGEEKTGYGECVAGDGPWYSYETIDTAWHVLSDFIVPATLGKEFEDPKELLAGLGIIRRHNMAKACFEEAFWDLFAKEKGVPLWKLLGGSNRRIESGVSIGIQKDMKSLVSCVGNSLEKGYKRIKIKIKPGWDLEAVRKIREEFGDIPLMVDANSAYTLRDAQLFKKLDRYELMMIEQPLAHDDLEDHAELQASIETPICLDESIESLRDAKIALRLGSCRMINIKKGRVGGLSPAVDIHDYCKQRGIPVWAGGMLEMGIGRAHNVALATLPNFRLPNDISPTERYYTEDVTEPPLELNPDGTLDVPTGEGIGVEVKWERIERITSRSKTLEAK